MFGHVDLHDMFIRDKDKGATRWMVEHGLIWVRLSEKD